MAFTVEHVKSLLQRDLVTELEKAKINIVAKIKQVPYLSQSKLYEHLTVLKTVLRLAGDIQMVVVGRPLH